MEKLTSKYIEMKGSPEELYYDDDLTVAQDADLKKVTIQIKDQMDELLEYVHNAETDKRLSDDLGMTPRSGRPTMKKTFSDVLAMQKSGTGGTASVQPSGDVGMLQRRVIDITSMIREMKVAQTAQEQSQKRLRNDVKEIKQLLWKLARDKSSGGGDLPEERGSQDRTPSPSNRAPSRGPITVDVDPKRSSDRGEGSNIFSKRRKEPVDDEVLARMVAPAPSEPELDVRLSPVSPEVIEMAPLPGSATSSRGSTSLPITVDVTVHRGGQGQGSTVPPEQADSSNA